MAYDPARIAAARAAVRWNYTLGSLRPAPVAPQLLEPTTETTLDALRRSLKADLVPLPISPPPKRSPTEFRGANRTYSFDLITFAGIGNSGAQVTEIFTLPGIVRRILISTDLTTEALGELIITTALSVNPDEAEIRAGPQIFPDPRSGVPAGGIFAVASGAPFAVPLDYVLSSPPFRLAAYLENIDAGPHRAAVSVTLQDLDPEDIRIISVPAILQQQVYGRALRAAPLPPPRGPAMPRAVRILVQLGVQPGFYRDVSFRDLAPELKRLAIDPVTSQWVGTRTLEAIW